MSGLTEAERRGAIVLALLITLATLQDLWVATHPRATPELKPTATEVAPRDSHAVVPMRGEPMTVDLATADATQLDALPGIGPVLAERIVQTRGRMGGFRRVDDLLAVPGIGPRLLERLRSQLRVGAGR